MRVAQLGSALLGLGLLAVTPSSVTDAASVTAVRETQVAGLLGKGEKGPLACFSAYTNQLPAEQEGRVVKAATNPVQCAKACLAAKQCYAFAMQYKGGEDMTLDKCMVFLNLGDVKTLKRVTAENVQLYVKNHTCKNDSDDSDPESPVDVSDSDAGNDADDEDSDDSDPIHIEPISDDNGGNGGDDDPSDDSDNYHPPSPADDSDSPKDPHRPDTPPPVGTPKPKPWGLNEFEERIWETIVDPASQTTTFNDIVGLQRVKAALHDNVILPTINPNIFDGPLLQPAKGLLLFGPPGNGKTYIAKAVAKMAGATFMSIGAASVGSKWHGEGENLMRAVFTLARKIQPVIIFFDEIDGLLKKRGGNDDEHEAVRKIKTEFLAGLDGMDSKVGERVLALGASNRPMDLDDAALRRFPERYMVGMPGKMARRQIIDSLMKDTHIKHNITETDYQWFVENTQSYSASDVTNALKDAAMAPIDEFAKKILDEDGIDGDYDPKKEDIDISKLRPVCRQDLEDSLLHVKPSVSDRDLKELVAWNEKFGAFAADDDENLQLNWM